MPFFSSLGATFGRLLIVVAVIITVISETSTFAGNGVPGNSNGVQFNGVSGVAVDSAGNVYVSETTNNRIRKITPGGVVSTFAGSTNGFLDGTGINTRFNVPRGIAVDSVGNFYVADTHNQRIRKITPAGVVTTFAGNETSGSTNGTGTNATFNYPSGIAVDSAGFVYVADSFTSLIRKITPDGVVSTLAGNGTNGNADGTGSNATFAALAGVAVDSAGNVYVGDSGNSRIRKITPGGVVSTLAGSTQGFLDGNGINAQFNLPSGVSVDSAGNVYVGDAGNHRIRKIAPNGVVSTYAGSGIPIFTEGTGTNASFNVPYGVTLDSTGNVYVTDQQNHRICKITPAGVVSTLAGNGFNTTGQGYGDTIGNALFISPHGVAVDSSGTIYVADTSNHRIRKITPGGITSTLAGNGVSSTLDGTGVGSSFFNPRGVAVDSSGTIYVADTSNQRIRKITSAGVVTTLAGSTNGSLNGTGTNAQFSSPTGVAVDSAGNVYVGDAGNHRIRKIAPNGVVTTLAGSTAAFQDGTGTNARFNLPSGVAVDSAGFVYVGDRSNNRIRKITPGGVVSTLAGQAAAGNADGTGSNATFRNPYGVAVDSAGTIYVADTSNHRIRKITPGGVVSTLAGQSLATGSTDGTGTDAGFSSPTGVAVDSSGTIYVADQGNHRIRKITSAGVVTTLAGSVSGFQDEGIFSSPVGLATDLMGNVILAETEGNVIRNIRPSGIVSRIAGTGAYATNESVSSLLQTFRRPIGVAVDPTRFIYIADLESRVIRRSRVNLQDNASGPGSTFVGRATVSGFADGTGTNATFNTIIGITIDPTGTVYISDIGNHNIRRITPGGVVTTLAGSRTPTFADGAGTGASFNTPQGIVADIYGNVYIADTNNHRIRRVTSDGIVTTLAGSGSPGFLDSTGTNAQFNFPYQIAIDPLGTLYVTDEFNRRIRKITQEGVVTTLAGSGVIGLTNGIALESTFTSPRGITVDRFRNAYISETNNHSIRKITNVYTLPENNGNVTTLNSTILRSDQFFVLRGLVMDSFDNIFLANGPSYITKISPTNIISVYAGRGSSGPPEANVSSTSATFNTPWGIGMNDDGYLFIGDSANHCIRRIESWGFLLTKLWAGTGSPGFNDTYGSSALFNTPRGVAVSRLGLVYVADSGNHRIRMIIPSSVMVLTLAGQTTAGNADGSRTNAQFNTPSGVAVDSAGFVYVADTGNHRIRKITPGGVVSTLAGSTQGFLDGNGINAQFNSPLGIGVDLMGNVYVADQGNHRIRKITPAGLVTTLAGSTQGSAEGIGTNAQFNLPIGLFVHSSGNVYVTDSTRICKIGNSVQLPLNRGVVTTLAGSGTLTFANGTGTSASFQYPWGLTVDPVGNVYVADWYNHRIRRITPAGVVTTYTGSGILGFQDGSSTGARFNHPTGISMDRGGNMYVADSQNYRIRRITTTPTVISLAGNGLNEFADGTGTNARFNDAYSVAVNSSGGNIYVADGANHRIRKITPGGVVSTFAGQAPEAFADGTGTNASFNFPYGVAVDPYETIYIADTYNHRIRKITPAGVVSTLAGSGTPTFADGVGAGASFNQPYGLAVDSAGFVYVADQGNHRIRKITPGGVVTTIAGNGSTTVANGTGTAAGIPYPYGVAVDEGGILYVTSASRIRKIQ